MSFASSTLHSFHSFCTRCMRWWIFISGNYDIVLLKCCVVNTRHVVQQYALLLRNTANARWRARWLALGEVGMMIGSSSCLYLPISLRLGNFRADGRFAYFKIRQSRHGLPESVPGLRGDQRESAHDNAAGARVQRLPLHSLVVPPKVRVFLMLLLCSLAAVVLGRCWWHERKVASYLQM